MHFMLWTFLWLTRISGQGTLNLMKSRILLIAFGLFAGFPVFFLVLLPPLMLGSSLSVNWWLPQMPLVILCAFLLYVVFRQVVLERRVARYAEARDWKGIIRLLEPLHVNPTLIRKLVPFSTYRVGVHVSAAILSGDWKSIESLESGLLAAGSGAIDRFGVELAVARIARREFAQAFDFAGRHGLGNRNSLWQKFVRSYAGIAMLSSGGEVPGVPDLDEKKNEIIRLLGEIVSSLDATDRKTLALQICSACMLDTASTSFSCGVNSSLTFTAAGGQETGMYDASRKLAFGRLDSIRTIWPESILDQELQHVGRMPHLAWFTPLFDSARGYMMTILFRSPSCRTDTQTI